MTILVHPYVVHFAVGLILVSVLLFFLGTALGSRPASVSLLSAARWNLWIGSGLALASIASGFVDYIRIPCDLAAIEATILHRRSGAVTWWSSLIAGIAVYRTRHRAPGPALLGWLALVAAAATTAAVLGTGLTYGHGMGVSTTAWPAADVACFDLERPPG